MGYTSNLFLTTNIKAELTALMQELELARQRNLTPLEISTDCENLIIFLTQGNLMHYHLLFDCRQRLRRLGSPPIQHEYRELNKVADKLAKEFTKLTTSNIFFFFGKFRQRLSLKNIRQTWTVLIL